MRPDRLDGVLIIDKPKGPTSHDVVAKLRRALGTREIGHAGTLDPMATGVLVVCVGEATKLSPYLTASDKAYEATIALGVETDSLDAEGRETKRVDVPRSMLDALERLKSGSVHEHIARAIAHEKERAKQIPPAVSAIKKDGVASHVRARKGEAIDLAPRDVRVLDLRVVGGGVDDESGPWLAVTCDVSKGYYVRSLARDLAASLGTVGHLTALRRARSGHFTIEEAMPLDTPADELAARVIDVARAATRTMPAVKLSDAGAKDARFGRVVRAEDMTYDTAGVSDGPHAWIDASGRLVAIGEVDKSGGGRVMRGFTA